MSAVSDIAELKTILRDDLLYPVFQPIVDLQLLSIHGSESLIRGPANSTLHSPISLFETANRHNLMGPLEYACREAACRRFVAVKGQGKLFINVSPMSLLESGYQYGVTNKILEKLEIPAERVVIELSERYPLDDYQLLREATEHFREMGFEIAIDDLGAGYAGLRSWAEIRPDYVKIDRHFIDHINEDPVKREFVRSIQEIANELSCRVIAEGVETVEELETIRGMGIRFVQGYYLGRPEIAPVPASVVLSKLNDSADPQFRSDRSSTPVSLLSVNSPVIDSQMLMRDVFDIIVNSPQLYCLPVIDNGKPVGMIERQAILELFTSPYARDLYARKPVCAFMETDPVIVDGKAKLEDVSRILTDNNSKRLKQHFIITRRRQYYGLGTTSTLLRKITEQQIRNARYANPLTMLPGNVPIYEQLENKLRQQDDFHVAYIDLNNFKPFNDYYGYSQGDDVLVMLSQLLQTIVCDLDDFIGHVGGDDFVVIFSSDNWQQQCHQIIDEFSKKVAEFYKPKDREAGGIIGVSRQGEEQFFDLLSLVIGVVHPDPLSCQSFHDVATLAMEAKMVAKRLGGNQVYFSRRRRPNHVGHMSD